MLLKSINLPNEEHAFSQYFFLGTRTKICQRNWSNINEISGNFRDRSSHVYLGINKEDGIMCSQHRSDADEDTEGSAVPAIWSSCAIYRHNFPPTSPLASSAM